MAKVKNLTLYGSKEEMDRLEEEYRWAGKWAVRRQGPGQLTVFAIAPPKPKKKPQKKKRRDEEDEAPKKNLREQRPKRKNFSD